MLKESNQPRVQQSTIDSLRIKILGEDWELVLKTLPQEEQTQRHYIPIIVPSFRSQPSIIRPPPIVSEYPVLIDLTTNTSTLYVPEPYFQNSTLLTKRTRLNQTLDANQPSSKRQLIQIL